MENFTPISASIGGALIGVSAALLMALNGRIAGISGVFSGAAFAERGDKLWRILFVAGLVAAPALWALAQGAQPPFEITQNWSLIIGGGCWLVSEHGLGLVAPVVTASVVCRAYRLAQWCR